MAVALHRPTDAGAWNAGRLPYDGLAPATVTHGNSTVLAGHAMPIRPVYPASRSTNWTQSPWQAQDPALTKSGRRSPPAPAESSRKPSSVLPVGAGSPPIPRSMSTVTLTAASRTRAPRLKHATVDPHPAYVLQSIHLLESPPSSLPNRLRPVASFTDTITGRNVVVAPARRMHGSPRRTRSDAVPKSTPSPATLGRNRSDSAAAALNTSPTKPLPPLPMDAAPPAPEPVLEPDTATVDDAVPRLPLPYVAPRPLSFQTEQTISQLEMLAAELGNLCPPVPPPQRDAPPREVPRPRPREVQPLRVRRNSPPEGSASILQRLNAHPVGPRASLTVPKIVVTIPSIEDFFKEVSFLDVADSPAEEIVPAEKDIDRSSAAEKGKWKARAEDISDDENDDDDDADTDADDDAAAARNSEASPSTETATPSDETKRPIKGEDPDDADLPLYDVTDAPEFLAGGSKSAVLSATPGYHSAARRPTTPPRRSTPPASPPASQHHARTTSSSTDEQERRHRSPAPSSRSSSKARTSPRQARRSQSPPRAAHNRSKARTGRPTALVLVNPSLEDAVTTTTVEAAAATPGSAPPVFPSFDSRYPRPRTAPTPEYHRASPPLHYGNSSARPGPAVGDYPRSSETATAAAKLPPSSFHWARRASDEQPPQPRAWASAGIEDESYLPQIKPGGRPRLTSLRGLFKKAK